MARGSTANGACRSRARLGFAGNRDSGDLAHWLGLTPGELEWFADLHGLTKNQRVAQLRHYRYRLVPKSSGGMPARGNSQDTAKVLQTQILEGILDFVPPHPAAHGLCGGFHLQTLLLRRTPVTG